MKRRCITQVTGTDGARLREAKSINRSLATLCDVIEALAANSRATTHGGGALQKRHVPYRNSTLTWLLKDGLGGNAFATMLATVSPSEDHYEETRAAGPRCDAPSTLSGKKLAPGEAPSSTNQPWDLSSLGSRRSSTRRARER